MNQAEIDEAVVEANRFLKAVDRRAIKVKENADDLKRRQKEQPDNQYLYAAYTPTENGAVKRASLDLSRALARLRK